MIIRFIRNLWEEIEERDWEGGLIGTLTGLGMFLVFLGFGLGTIVLVSIGFIFLSIPVVLILYFFIRYMVFDLLKEAYKRTKEEKRE